jgi:hypothetical protein
VDWEWIEIIHERFECHLANFYLYLLFLFFWLLLSWWWSYWLQWRRKLRLIFDYFGWISWKNVSLILSDQLTISDERVFLDICLLKGLIWLRLNYLWRGIISLGIIDDCCIFKGSWVLAEPKLCIIASVGQVYISNYILFFGVVNFFIRIDTYFWGITATLLRLIYRRTSWNWLFLRCLYWFLALISNWRSRILFTSKHR